MHGHVKWTQTQAELDEVAATKPKMKTSESCCAARHGVHPRLLTLSITFSLNFEVIFSPSLTPEHETAILWSVLQLPFLSLRRIMHALYNTEYVMPL